MNRFAVLQRKVLVVMRILVCESRGVDYTESQLPRGLLKVSTEERALSEKRAPPLVTDSSWGEQGVFLPTKRY